MNKLAENTSANHDADIWSPALQQQVFRNLLSSFSYPGRVIACANKDTTAWLATLIALLDGETTLADPHQLLTYDLWPKLEAHPVTPEKAAFILADGLQAPDFIPFIGTLDTPETGATLLLRVTSLRAAMAGDDCLQLTGPGIKPPLSLCVEGLHPAWIASRNEWVAAFPLGIDMVLCDAQRFVALPRTTQIKTGVEA